MASTSAAADPESSGSESDSASSYSSSEAAAYQEFSGSDADSAYSSSEEEEAEQEEKEAHRSPLSPKKMAVFPAAPKSPPPSAVSSMVDEREDEDEDSSEDDDGVEDGSSNQEFVEGETDKQELKMQPRFSSDPDSSDKTPPPAPNPPAAVSSKDDEDGSKDEDDEGDESSGESDDGEAIRCLPSLDSSPLNTSSPHLNSPSHNSQDLKSSSAVSMDTPPEPIKHAGSALPARCCFKRKHAEIDNSEENDNRSRKRFQKLWALDDEIALLNGLVKYLSDKGTVPFSVNDMDSVRLLIKSSFHLDVSNKQLADKVRRLKKKFQINSARLKNKITSIVFNHHEQSLYDLSKKLWSDKTIPPTKKVANVNSECEYAEENRQKPEVKKLNSDDASTHLKVSERTIQGNLRYPLLWETVSKLADGLSCGASMKKAFEIVDDFKANVIEKKLKKLRLNEMRHHLNGVNLNTETMKFIIDSLQG